MEGGNEAGAAAATADDRHFCPDRPDFYSLPDGLLGVTCLGVRKFQLRGRRVQSDGLNLGEVDWLAAEREIELTQRISASRATAAQSAAGARRFYQAVAKRFEDSAWVGYRLAEILPLSLSDKTVLSRAR